MNETRRNAQLFERLQAAASSRPAAANEERALLPYSADSWAQLVQSWTAVGSRTEQWREKLDRSLPGKLGQLGQTISRTERLLTISQTPGSEQEGRGMGGREAMGEENRGEETGMSTRERLQQLEVHVTRGTLISYCV